MKDFQRANLETLRDYLLGPLKAKFDMESYGDDGSCKRDTCGTVGCAIGHATYAIEPKCVSESWEDYTFRVFGTEPFELPWDWCFGPCWSDIDNTPQGAANRINYLLEYGVPLNWREIMRGDEPICY